MAYRPDGSYNSSNNPTWGNRFLVRDYGLYKAMVREVYYSDENATRTKTKPLVTYNLVIIGGERDGEYFSNAVDMAFHGGLDNYSERLWKPSRTITQQDPGALTATETQETLNGDVVYIQFLNGDLKYPVILGGARHTDDTHTSAIKEERSKLVSKFNGWSREITKDGELTWTKSNGAYQDTAVPDTRKPGRFLQEQFVALPGQENAIKITLNNEYNLKLAYDLGGGLEGISVELDGLKDSWTTKFATGFEHKIDAIADTFSVTSVAGTNLVLNGITDTIALATNIGASVTIDGILDTVTTTTAGGSSIEISGTSGITASEPVGASMSLSTGDVEISSVGGAKLNLTPAGKVTLGNSAVELLDLVDQAFTALSTQTAVGFGAPTSTVATFVQLATQIKLLKG